MVSTIVDVINHTGRGTLRPVLEARDSIIIMDWWWAITATGTALPRCGHTAELCSSDEMSGGILNWLHLHTKSQSISCFGGRIKLSTEWRCCLPQLTTCLHCMAPCRQKSAVWNWSVSLLQDNESHHAETRHNIVRINHISNPQHIVTLTTIFQVNLS